MAFAIGILATFGMLVEIPPLAPSIHSSGYMLFEMLRIAGVAAISSVAWHAPHGEYRLRPTLVAALSVPSIAFGLIHALPPQHLTTLIGATHAREASFYAGPLSLLFLPFILGLLLTRRFSDEIPNTIRWSTLLAAIAATLAMAWLLARHIDWLPTADSPTAPAIEDAIRFLLIGLYCAVALAATLSPDSKQPVARNVLLSCLLGICAQALLLSFGADDVTARLVGHLLGIFTVVTAFAATYAEAIGIPYSALEQAHAAAERDRSHMEAVFGAIAEGVIVVDTNLTIKAMNPVAHHLASDAENTSKGIPLARFLSIADPVAANDMIAAVVRCLGDGRTHRPQSGAIAWKIGGVTLLLEGSASPIRALGEVRGAVLTLRNVTERSRLLEELRHSAQYARSLIDASPDPILSIDADGLIADVNHAAERIAHQPRGRLIGQEFASLFLDSTPVRDALGRIDSEGTIRNLTLTLATNEGRRTEVACSIAPYRNASGDKLGVFAIARDITELRQVQMTLEFQATCDPLTALPNRRMFREHTERALVRARRSGNHAAILIVDLDNFKDVNDALGHAIGDDLIKGVGDRLRACLRETDLVARIGGDEFGILMEDMSHPDDAYPLTSKILASIAVPLQLAGGEVTVSCSIGVAVFPVVAGDADALLRYADTAMYRAKESGKNNCQFFTDDMNSLVQRRIDLGNRLRRALDRGELSLHYQPQMCLATGAIVGFEALLRWRAEDIGSISPVEFIPIAEDSGLIVSIGGWALREACRQAARWRAQFGRDIAIAVNLSARQFRDHDIVDSVIAAIKESGLPPHLLDLELTESVLVRDPSRVADTLVALKAVGVRISIDDFGTGYSSLSYLKRFPLDYLKIDRAFVRDVPGTRNDEAIVRSIVALARSLDLRVIAEGVETEAQQAFLRDLGCDGMQGFFLSRPRPASEIAEFLEARPLPPIPAPDHTQ